MIRAALFALALIATPALADPPEEELTAAPGSIAYGMIEEASAEGVFDIVHNGQVSVRHLASGLRCDFERNGEGGEIVIFAELTRGDNVGCVQDEEGVALTTYATRYPTPTNVQDQIQIADEAIRRRFGDAVPYIISDESNTALQLPARHVRYIVTWNGARSFTRASVVIVGDWVIKMRFTAHATDDAATRDAERRASMILTQTLSALTAPGNL